MKIHGIAFLLIGIFVSAVSYFINFEQLKFFFYVGIVFIVFGLLKWFVTSAFGKNRRERKSFMKQINLEPKKEQNKKQINIIQEAQKQQSNQMQKTQINQQQNPKFCHNCGNQLKGYEKFCPYCGAQQF